MHVIVKSLDNLSFFPPYYDGDITLFHCIGENKKAPSQAQGWRCSYWLERVLNLVVSYAQQVSESLHFSIGIFSSELIDDLREEGYCSKVFSELLKVLMSVSSSKNNSLIRSYSNELIIELLLIGHSIEDISDYLRRTFSKYELDSNDGIEYIRTDFENSSINRNDYLNLSEYSSALRTYLDNLSLLDRVESFSLYLTYKATTYYAIFQVFGYFIKGESIFEYQNMKLYNHEHVTVVPKNLLDSFVKMPNSNTEKVRYSTLVVQVDAVTPNSANNLAVLKSERLIDILRYFNNNSLSLIYRSDDVTIADEDFELVYQLISSPIKRASKELANLSPVNIETHHINNVLNKFSKSLEIISSKNTFLFLSIQRSFSLFSKAETSQNLSDKILNYWITIENLFSLQKSNNRFIVDNKKEEHTFDIINEIIPRIKVIYYKSEVLKDTLNHIYNLFIDQNMESKGEHFDYPDSIIESLHLKSDIPVDPDIFIGLLNSLISKSFNKLLIEKLEYTKEFYTNMQFTHCEVKKLVERTQVELALIYRARNQIAHNAKLDSMILPYFVNVARKLCKLVLTQVFHSVNSGKTEFNDIFLTEVSRAELLLRKTDVKGASIDIFKF